MLSLFRRSGKHGKTRNPASAADTKKVDSFSGTRWILSLDRWPQGARDTIDVPPHQNCKINGNDIVATFHTHPNTGADYLQEPSQTDQRAVRDDPNLKGAFYVGEFVISNDAIYLIAPNGQVSEIGKNRDVIG